MHKPTTDQILDGAFEPEVATFYKDLLRGVGHEPNPDQFGLVEEPGPVPDAAWDAGDWSVAPDGTQPRAPRHPHLRLVEDT